MASIGELFIQLGVLGNANELKKANQEFQKANVLAEKQAKLEKLRAEYLEKIQKAQNKAEKQELVKQYKAKKTRIEQQTNLRLRTQEQKALQSNIAQWATYAHMVTLASAQVISAIKKINDEAEKQLLNSQVWNNLKNQVSTPYNTLRAYAKAGNLANPSMSEEAVAGQLINLNSRFDLAKRNGSWDSLVNSDVNLYGADAQKLYGQVFSRQITDFADYLERVRSLIAGRNPEEQRNLVQGFLGDDSLLPMLQMSKEQLSPLLQKAMSGQLSEGQIEEGARLRQEISAIQSHLNNLKDQFINAFLPKIRDIWQKIDAIATKLIPSTEETNKFQAKVYNFFKPTITEIKATWDKFITENKDIVKVLRSLWIAIKMIIDVILVPIRGLIQLGIVILGAFFKLLGSILGGMAKRFGVDVDTHLQNMEEAYQNFHNLLNGSPTAKENAFKTLSTNTSSIVNNQNKDNSTTFDIQNVNIQATQPIDNPTGFTSTLRLVPQVLSGGGQFS